MLIFRDWSVWFIDNFMKMPQLNRKYPCGAAKRKARKYKADFYRRISFYVSEMKRLDKILISCDVVP